MPHSRTNSFKLDGSHAPPVKGSKMPVKGSQMGTMLQLFESECDKKQLMKFERLKRFKAMPRWADCSESEDENDELKHNFQE